MIPIALASSLACMGRADTKPPDDGTCEELTWYADGDGDGFGDPSLGVDSCEAPEGFVEDATDCDDEDLRVHPDAAETCDGLDNDCDPSTSEAGTASWTSSEGSVEDVTALVSGTEGAPAAATLDEPGTLAFCSGTFTVNLDLRADVTVEGTGSTLDGGGAGSVVRVTGDGLAVRLFDLSIENGTAEDGGGVHCAGEGTSVELEGVLLGGNEATNRGGGVFSDRCDVSVFDSHVRDNSAAEGGGLYLAGGSHDLSLAVVHGNDASGSTGGLLVDGGDATVGGDFGEAGDDNAGHDITTIADRTSSYVAGDGVSFEVVEGVMEGAATTTAGGEATTSSGSWLLGTVFEATTDGTLESFAPLTGTESGCELDFYVLGSDSAQSGGWEVLFASTGQAATTSNELSEVHVGMPVEKGKSYALSWNHAGCSSHFTYDNNSTGVGDALEGLGEVLGVVYRSDVTAVYEVGDTTTSLTYWTGRVYRMEVTATVL